ncbi:TniQ family protein [Methylobacterium radiotolerans]|uniref:TniQ family protein n=1 Tax=Methylobacterium radiotolerans TaxID=31998 RepID=UPI000D5E938B|nr:MULTISPECIES: TniQ family protein [Methylobacterium]MDE3749564.1 TniQ family protein [Methylobacterium radiotolerans]PVZ05956.1 TniQ protein [Methylobacterium organophilum]
MTRERPLRRHLIQRWHEPGEHEPATGFFSRLAGHNLQTSARVLATDMGFDGREMAPADCLDAVSHLDIAGMQALVHATPVVKARTVRLLGVDVRRRHWSEAPRVCPGCLAESPHHRTYHSLLAFTVCPHHGCEIVGGLDGPLAWWHPHLDRAPDGTMIARQMPRLQSPLACFEAWLLGRLGVDEPLDVPLLADVSVLMAIDTVEFLGRASLGGWRVAAPRIGTPGFARKDVVRAGFDVLSGSPDALDRFFDQVASESENRIGAGGSQWGAGHAYGWLYKAIFFTRNQPYQLEAIRTAAARVARRRGAFARSATTLEGVDEKVPFLHQDEVARACGLHSRFVGPIAERLGIRPLPSRDRFVRYDASTVPAMQEALASCVPRADAARILGLRTTELDALARQGLITPLCRLGGPTVASDRYRREEVEALLPDEDLTVVESGTDGLMSLSEYADSTRQWRPEVIALWKTGTIHPVGRDPDQTGLAALLFEPPAVGSSGSGPQPLSEPGGRMRRQTTRPGLTRCDAAALIGINMATLGGLVDDGYLRVLTPEESGTTRERIDEQSLQHVITTYAPAVAYADVLDCGRTDAVRRLRDLGVDILVKKPGSEGLMAMVMRSQVTRALGLVRDPLAQPSTGWSTFWTAFGDHLVARSSVFRLARIPNAPEVRMRSGDRRTVIAIDMGCDGRAVMTLEKGPVSLAERRAERSGFVHRDTASWPIWFEWLETASYRMRMAGAHTDIAA